MMTLSRPKRKRGNNQAAIFTQPTILTSWRGLNREKQRACGQLRIKCYCIGIVGNRNRIQDCSGPKGRFKGRFMPYEN